MTPLFDLSQLVAAATLTISLCALGIIGATMALARPELLGRRSGWLLLAAGLTLLSARVIGHFSATDVETWRQVLAIVAAPLVPLGLWLILRRAPEAKDAR